MRTLALAATKGGVGKTTLAACLAVEASKKGRVALFDLDPQQSLARWLELRGEDPKIFTVNARSAKQAVEIAQQEGAHLLIIDTPPALMLAIEPAVAVADFVLIPCKPSPLDIESIGPIRELCVECLDRGRHSGFVLSQVFTQGGAGLTEGARLYLKEEGLVLTPIVGHRIAYAGAMADGRTGPEVDKSGKCGEEITALWKAVARELK